MQLYVCLLSHLQMMAFENTVVKEGNIAYNEQFLYLPRCALFSMIKLSFWTSFYICEYIISKSSAAYLLYVGKGKTIHEPFPSYKRFLTPLQQTTFEQFLLWPQCFQLYLTIKLSFMDIFQVFVTMFSKSSAAYLLYVGKGKMIH